MWSVFVPAWVEDPSLEAGLKKAWNGIKQKHRTLVIANSKGCCCILDPHDSSRGSIKR